VVRIVVKENLKGIEKLTTVCNSLGISRRRLLLEWLYSFFDPAIIRKMPKENFVIISKTGALGIGEFPYHTWHKEEKEDILAACGLKVEYGEPVEAGDYRGTFKAIGDKKHSEIIKLYASGLSMNKISEQTKRSTQSIKDHIDSHNSSVERPAFCPSCQSSRQMRGKKHLRLFLDDEQN